MDERISATRAARELSDLLNRVRYRGERFVIERGGEVVAELAPHAGAARATFADLVRAVRAAPACDAGFADDLEAVQAEQPDAPAEPWRS